MVDRNEKGEELRPMRLKVMIFNKILTTREVKVGLGQSKLRSSVGLKDSCWPTTGFSRSSRPLCPLHSLNYCGLVKKPRPWQLAHRLDIPVMTYPGLICA